MIKPKLYVFNTVRDLLTTNLEYYKHYHEKTGRPGDLPLDGLITVTFASGYDDDVLLRWITHSEEGELCTLTKGKIVFYYADGYGEKLCEYRFADAGLIYWKEVFNANGPEPMTVTMTISAAIQEFLEQTLIKHWQESWIVSSSKGFRSFTAFKRACGTAGKNKAWHHIVEQHDNNVAKFGAKALHITNNLIILPNGKGLIHAKVSGYYNSLIPGTNMRVRDYVKTLSYDEQYKYGIDVLKRFGWIQ